MITPTININGTSKDALLDQMCEVTEPLYVALRRLLNARPHRRDYPLAEYYARAQEQHQEWEERLRRTASEIVDWIHNVEMYSK